MTRDKSIISIISHGLRINVDKQLKKVGPHEYNRTKLENKIVVKEINKLGNKGVIGQSQTEKGDPFSNVFITPKKHGKYITILNLKNLTLIVTRFISKWSLPAVSQIW